MNGLMNNWKSELRVGETSVERPSAIPFWANSSFRPFLGGWRGGRVVYCGGLENRFGFTADGGSNPSLSANIGEPRSQAGTYAE
jgi:hypothetical protein